MNPDEVIEENETARVGVLVDLEPHEPYDDGRTPILELRYRRHDRPQVSYLTNIGGYRPVEMDRIVEACQRWGTDELFRRYLRIFHGTRAFEEFSSRDAEYITFDTADWRTHNGLAQEDSEGYADLADYRAYVEDECYGWAIEQRVGWTRDDDPESHMSTWETVESVWGYYGYEYAQEEAREAWAAFLAAQDKEQNGQGDGQ